MSTIDEIQKQGKLLKNALIVCNGNPPPKSLLYKLWEKTTYRVAADGGANLLVKSKCMPDAVIGDFDSLKSKTREKMPNTKFFYIPEQDTNDADKAVRHCLKLGFKEIHILSADGGRQDQFLSGLEILFKYSKKARLISWTQMERMEFIYKNWEEKIQLGTTLSMLPVFGVVQGIVTKGLKYPLKNQSLIPGESPSGVSNLVVSTPVKINLTKGRLLVVIQHKEFFN